MARDFRKEITDKLVGMLERDEAPPWRKPWATKDLDVPRNAISGKPYRGGNAYLLMMAGLGGDNRWLTSAQLHDLAGQQLRAAGIDAVYEKNERAEQPAGKGRKAPITKMGRGWVDRKTNEPVDKALLPRLAKGAEWMPVELWVFEGKKEVENDQGEKSLQAVRYDRPMLRHFFV